MIDQNSYLVDSAITFVGAGSLAIASSSPRPCVARRGAHERNLDAVGVSVSTDGSPCGLPTPAALASLREVLVGDD